MQKTIRTLLLTLAAVTLVGMSSASFAEERVVKVKVRADSEYPGNEAFRAMDGNPGSIWHSLWKPPAEMTPLPHEIVVDLGGVYEISGFTYVPRTGTRNGRIKDYEVYLSGPNTTSIPFAKGIGDPVVKGTFENPDGENVVNFPAPVKGRYFRLRALSNVTGQETWAGVGDLSLHCEGVKFVGQPWSLRVDFPEAGADAIALIEEFPLLEKLLEIPEPWSLDPIALKEQLFPAGMEALPGSGDPPGVFVNRRAAQNWGAIDREKAEETKAGEQPGLRVWDYHAYETDYYALPSACPLIRLHLGRPVLEWVKNMNVLYPELPESAPKDVPAKMDRIVEALKPYGAEKLPIGLRSYRYLLPGGTRVTISDHTVEAMLGALRETCFVDPVRLKIDFEPAAPPQGRENQPFLVPWRTADRSWEGPPTVLGTVRPWKAVAAVPTEGLAPERQWPDRPTGFASVDAMGQNGTTGGAGGKVVTVTTQEELEKYAQAEEPYIIRVPGEIKITEKQNPRTRYEKLTTKEIHIASNKTIVGVGKSGHIVDGGFFIGPGMHNIILRNLTIRDTYVKGDWAGLTNDYDGLQMDKAHHIWIDHCHFTRHGDGCIDGRAGTTYVTLSWCILSDHNKTFGIGWDSEARTSWTVHHNWFRNVACRTGGGGQVLRVHLYNNYWLNVGVVGPGANNGTNLIFQNNLLDNVNNPLTLDPHSQCGPSTVVAIGNIFKNVRGRNQTGGTAFYDPGMFYAYTLDKAGDLQEIIEKYCGPQENIGE